MLKYLASELIEMRRAAHQGLEVKGPGVMEAEFDARPHQIRVILRPFAYPSGMDGRCLHAENDIRQGRDFFQSGRCDLNEFGPGLFENLENVGEKVRHLIRYPF